MKNKLGYLPYSHRSSKTNQAIDELENKGFVVVRPMISRIVRSNRYSKNKVERLFPAISNILFCLVDEDNVSNIPNPKNLEHCKPYLTNVNHQMISCEQMDEFLISCKNHSIVESGKILPKVGQVINFDNAIFGKIKGIVSYIDEKNQIVTIICDSFNKCKFKVPFDKIHV